MKITYSWLKEHLDSTATPAVLAERLTAIGLEVESVTRGGLEGFVIAEVLSAERHPNADKLRVCQVSIGKGTPIQVVCGAPNARAGMKSVFAAPGMHIPGTGIQLAEGNIRGQASRGMLCSARELGLGEDHDGIMDLPADAPVGEDFARWRGLDDVLIDINVTPNRADCLSVRGIARDLAAAGLGALKPLALSPHRGTFPSPLRWEIKDDGCVAVAGVYFRNVTNGESPQWLKDRLASVGQRSISALVDITNYMTLDLGRPLHVFDADKISGDTLTMRAARDGENLAALDGNTYDLGPDMLVIADKAGPLALGGIMGGAPSGVSVETRNVFLEVALFDPRRIARTGRMLNLQSDARYRFERGVDPQSLVWGTARAIALIMDLCGGEASVTVLAGEIPAQPAAIPYRPSRTETLGGLKIDPASQEMLLTRLGFAIERGESQWRASPPSWRGDISGEADIVEELLRLEGYDAIPMRSLPLEESVPEPVLTIVQRRAQAAKRLLATRGLMEAVTFSFMAGATARHFLPSPVALANPISVDLDVLRPSILGNLLAAAQRNAARGEKDTALFEVGPVYLSPSERDQFLVATGLRVGLSHPRQWQGGARPVDFFDAKADCLALLEEFSVPTANLQIERAVPAYYHPGRAASLRLGPAILGYCGEMHPGLLGASGLGEAMAVGFELFLDRLPQPRVKAGQARAPLVASPYQAVERDFAFLVDRGQSVANLLKAARGADKLLITAARVFDLYEGEKLPAGKKSVALAITLQASDRTLTDKEIEETSARIVAAVTRATGAELRT